MLNPNTSPTLRPRATARKARVCRSWRRRSAGGAGLVLGREVPPRVRRLARVRRRRRAQAVGCQPLDARQLRLRLRMHPAPEVPPLQRLALLRRERLLVSLSQLLPRSPLVVLIALSGLEQLELLVVLRLRGLGGEGREPAAPRARVLVQDRLHRGTHRPLGLRSALGGRRLGPRSGGLGLGRRCLTHRLPALPKASRKLVALFRGLRLSALSAPFGFCRLKQPHVLRRLGRGCRCALVTHFWEIAAPRRRIAVKSRLRGLSSLALLLRLHRSLSLGGPKVPSCFLFAISHFLVLLVLGNVQKFFVRGLTLPRASD
mmetsp:Transcript_18589/g.51353  ORF Transcript_18589/g.51353 Transcript_18589/m.51353 type:complete len:316 (+) Transcript_18589:169-1116(+)